MAILKNVEIWYPRLVKPNSRHNKLNPTWEIQCRTTDPAQRDFWATFGLKPKVMKYSDEHEDADLAGELQLHNGKKCWKLNLKKRSLAPDGTAKPMVEVMNGHKKPVDGNTIGNGSIAHLKVFIFEYDDDSSPTGKSKGGTLMKVQLIKHKLYTPVDDEEFDEEETEVIVEDMEEGADKTTDSDMKQADDAMEKAVQAAEKANGLKPKASNPDNANYVPKENEY
jgi:hypothetical protein